MIPVFLNMKGYYPVTDDFAPCISIGLGNSIRAVSFQNDSGSGRNYSWKSEHKSGWYGKVHKRTESGSQVFSKKRARGTPYRKEQRPFGAAALVIE